MPQVRFSFLSQRRQDLHISLGRGKSYWLADLLFWSSAWTSIYVSKISLFLLQWINWECIISKVTQSQKEKKHVLLHMQNPVNKICVYINIDMWVQYSTSKRKWLDIRGWREANASSYEIGYKTNSFCSSNAVMDFSFLVVDKYIKHIRYGKYKNTV